MLYIYYGEAKNPTSLGYKNYHDVIAHITAIKQNLGMDYDIHFSANHCDGSGERNWTGCDLIYFDLDHPKVGMEAALKQLVDCTGIAESFWSVNNSGNGFHFFANMPMIEVPFEYDLFQAKYRVVLGLLNQTETGKWDAVFDNARTMRLPQTRNIKDSGETFAHIMVKGNGVVEKPFADVALALKDKRTPALMQPVKTAGQVTVLPPEQDPNKDYYVWLGGKADTNEVMSECNFLKHCKEHPEEVREPEWYAMISVVSRLDNGREMVHEMSCGHPKYNERETENKINQALTKTGPRKCASINAAWGGCHTCPHFNKISSPIQLRSKQHIATREQGFQSQVLTASGAIRYSPAYEDMIKFLQYDHNIKYLPVSKDFYRYEAGKYVPINDVQVLSIIRENFKPAVETKVTSETYKRLEQTAEIHVTKELDDYPLLLNCNNGVLNLATGELMPHSPDYLFTTKINVDYNPTAKAPKFQEWLEFILEGDKEKAQTIIDYLAYCIAGSKYFNEKILVCTGKGANGKSVLLKILKMLMGEYFAFTKAESFSKFGKEVLVGKRVICFEEIPSNTEKAFWEEIKDLSSGGTAVIERKFKPVFNYTSKAKFIFICNEMPYGSDANHGFFRRFIIAKFPKQFNENEIINHFEKNFEDELAGILNILIERIKVIEGNYFKIDVADSIKESLEEYKLDKDLIYLYFKEALTTEANAPRPAYYLQKVDCIVRLKALYTNHFNEWLQQQGYGKMPYNVFKRRFMDVAGKDFAYKKDGYDCLFNLVPSL